jgi:hypothetical protein
MRNDEYVAATVEPDAGVLYSQVERVDTLGIMRAEYTMPPETGWILVVNNASHRRRRFDIELDGRQVMNICVPARTRHELLRSSANADGHSSTLVVRVYDEYVAATADNQQPGQTGAGYPLTGGAPQTVAVTDTTGRRYFIADPRDTLAQGQTGEFNIAQTWNANAVDFRGDVLAPGNVAQAWYAPQGLDRGTAMHDGVITDARTFAITGPPVPGRLHVTDSEGQPTRWNGDNGDAIHFVFTVTGKDAHD